MQANESNVQLKVKAFKWIHFLKPFFLKDIVDTVRQNSEDPQHGFLYFLLGIYEEFGVGAKTNKSQALNYYKAGLEKYFDAFCAQRLAELYSEPNHMSTEVTADFTVSWRYVLVSVALMKSTYGYEITQGVEALQKIKSMADNDLQNSQSQLFDLMAQIGRKTAYANAIHHLAYIQVANDKFLETKTFSEVITLLMNSKVLDPQFVWETLFQYTITQSYCENHLIEQVYTFLLKGREQMLHFVKKIGSVYLLVLFKLPQDCELFKHFRYVIHELMLLRNDRTLTQTKTEKEIDEILNLILKNLFMFTIKRIEDINEKISIIRSYAEIVDNKELAIEILREEYQFKLNEEMNAYTHYRIASFTSDSQSALEGLKYAEKLFLTRIQSDDSSIVDKFISAYFLGKVTHKLTKLMQNSTFKNPIKTDLSQILPESDVSRASMREPNRSQLSFLNQPTSKYIQRQLDFTDYYIKAYLLYTQYVCEFYSYQTFQFQMVLRKIRDKLKKLGYDLSSFQFEPQVNTFFSINSIRLSQIRQNQTQILQISQINNAKANKIQYSIRSEQIELKTLIKRGSESQLYSGILTLEDQNLPCLFKVFPGLSEKQCNYLHKEIDKWQNVEGIIHLYGYCIESTQGDHYQFYIVQEALGANLLQIGSMTFQDRLNIMFQLATIVKGFHAQKLYHGNLKPENILLKYVENKTLVYVGDYGWPSVLLDDETDCRLDEYGYTSPETLAKNVMNFETDIWSVGVLFIQILSEFPLKDTIKTFKLYESQREWRSLDEAGFGRVTQLVNKMVNLEASRRPTMEQVLKQMKSWNFSHQF